MKFKNVLLIDDDTDDQEIFIEAAAEISPNINCTLYSDAEAALQHLAENIILPDAIFLDLNMPRMDGIEFLERLGRSFKFKDIPIFVYSTSNYLEVCKTRINVIATRCITKPDNYRELVRLLKDIFTAEEV